MANLLSSAASQETLPDSFVFPEDQRPPTSTAAVELPVPPPRRGPPRRPRRRQGARILQALDKFFALPAEDKAAFYSDDKDKPNRLFSGSMYRAGERERYWRDCLRLTCAFPVDDATWNDWPDKPHRIREVVERFLMATRALGMELLRLLCEGVGLRHDYFDGELSGGAVIVTVNHYPPCPDPARTLGLPPHCDRNLITLLRQGDVPGLQVAYRGGDWIDVRPVPGAFVVNFGHQLEARLHLDHFRQIFTATRYGDRGIATNGLLKSVEHRAVPDAAARPRTSVATFIMPTGDCLVAPAEELVAAAGEGPRYRAVTFREFMEVYKAVGARREGVEKAFKT
ncbi:hypothetical protein EJB05_15118, partial [Eragrostis curvula]